MLKTYLSQYASDWDDALCFVLFAYREIPVSEYGFSPLELVFGRNMKGPLSLLFDSWWESGEGQASPHVVDYMLRLRGQLQCALDVIHEQQRQAQDKAKVWYDKRAKSVSYKEGDLVKKLNCYV